MPTTSPKTRKDTLLDIRASAARLAKRPENKGKPPAELVRMAAARVLRRIIRRRLGITNLKNLKPADIAKLKKAGLVGGARPVAGTTVSHRITRGPRKGRTVIVTFGANGKWHEVKRRSVNLSGFDERQQVIDVEVISAGTDRELEDAQNTAAGWAGEDDYTIDEAYDDDPANLGETLQLAGLLEPGGDVRDLSSSPGGVLYMSDPGGEWVDLSESGVGSGTAEFSDADWAASI